jgi:hypothetical protein
MEIAIYLLIHIHEFFKIKERQKKVCFRKPSFIKLLIYYQIGQVPWEQSISVIIEFTLA